MWTTITLTVAGIILFASGWMVNRFLMTRALSDFVSDVSTFAHLTGEIVEHIGEGLEEETVDDEEWLDELYVKVSFANMMSFEML